MKPWYEQLTLKQMNTLLSLYSHSIQSDYISELALIIRVLIDLLEVRESIPTEIVVTDESGNIDSHEYHKDAADIERVKEEMFRRFKRNADEDAQEARSWLQKSYKRG